jgi:heat-inducible transcriptional repressor
MSPNSPRPSVPPPLDLSERARRVLSLLVREYVEHGEPVSSLWLASHSSLQVSSATVRNVLARLEELGLVHQPHTSAGRVPTDLGYRLYVDMLLDARRQPRPAPELEAMVRQSGTFGQALSSASQELARTLKYVSFALAPASASTTLRRIDFVSLDAHHVLVVLVTAGSQVVHKVLELAEATGPADLARAAVHLNEQFAGQQLEAIRATVLARLSEDRVLYDRMMARALTLASSTLNDVSTEPTLVVSGVSALVDEASPEEGGVPITALRALLSMIEEKHRLVVLLNGYIEGPGLTVVIGAEHTSPALRPLSLVASTTVDEGRATTMGVIGPTRMRYSRSIAAVEGASLAVGRKLIDGN